MFKLTLVALVALAAVAHAEVEPETKSVAAIVPSDEEEVGDLAEETKMFSDFCIKSRDTIKEFLDRPENSRLSYFFNFLFTPNGNSDVSQAPLMVKGSKAILKFLLPNTFQVYELLQALKAELPEGGVRQEIEKVCRSNEYKLVPKIEEQFDQIKDALKSSAEAKGVEGEPTLEVLSVVTYKNVGCVMAGRVGTVKGLCEVLTFASTWMGL